MCSGRGGDEPTTTDAHLHLGRIPPRLLGGEIPLDRDAAERGLERIGKTLGLDPLQMAEGVLEIAAWNQANAIRQVSVKRGLDPRDYTLVAFGGAGPLLAGRLLDLLSLRAALIPVSPGNLSALGLLVVDVKNDYVQTFVQRHDRLDHAAVNAHLVRLEGLAREALRRERFAEDQMRFVRTADMRYFGQAWEVRVDLPPGAMDATSAAETVKRFHDAHEKRFGYSYREVREPGVGRHVVEWVNLRVTGVGPIGRPRFPERPHGDGRSERALVERRPVRFDGARTDCAVYARDRLQPGDAVVGPAIVEEYGSTTVVFPGLRADVDRFGNLLLTRASGPSV
jgi:N-methylhydantoinase A